jgi:aminopeptidase N
MRSPASPTIFRQDYREPSFWVDQVELGFDLDAERTVVAARLHLRRRTPGPLVLNGEGQELLFLQLDGQRLKPSQYRSEGNQILVDDLPDRCVLDAASSHSPAANTTLSGLYVSGGNFFTQCEAEGFRRIAFFPDRPDVMARYTVMLRADKQRYPVLLSNGNLVAQGDLGDGRHYAKWEDPFPKPSYLFALVAGRLAHAEEGIRSQSGADKLLQIYVEPGDLDKVGHAMASLKHSIRWDEQRFGLELDLDRFMIVAVSDFNMGAMENKGLNVFNTKYVLASPESATDADFHGIEAVVGHEYFHNWTGNRVTCRDWFQLTLKEGLTVFRDQEFSADMAAGFGEPRASRRGGDTARAVKRIADARDLRTHQFPEDAGPMAHPVRPESYQEINNFYTATVYEKGAEIVRMLQTLLGRDGFRLGMDEYFRRHDGQAVTCDDFVAAMESVYRERRPGKDLSVFRRWYAQAGTPRVKVDAQYDAAGRRYRLTLTQSCPKVGVETRPGTPEKLPFHIPFAVGLIGADGQDMPLRLEREPQTAPTGTRVLEFTEEKQTFVFVGVDREPVPSLLRGFSAPVQVQFDYSDAQLAQLSAHDSDPFNRWEAGQRLATRELKRLVAAIGAGEALALSPALIEVYRSILEDAQLAPALKELALTLPDEASLALEFEPTDPGAIRSARVFARRSLAQALEPLWTQAYENHDTPGPYSPRAEDAARRGLKNLALSYLMELDGPAADLAFRQFTDAGNMTDRLGALHALQLSAGPLRARALEAFYQRYRGDALCEGKWLRAQATARRIDRPVLEVVQALMQHEAFSLRNPNKVYALLLAFFQANPAEFHRPDGAGYAFWAEQLLALDPLNPQVAARVARQLDRWTCLAEPMRAAAHAALKRVHKAKLSGDVAEIIGKALAA